MTQLNTPYPATAYLTGFLRAHGGELGLDVRQADASLLLFLRLFSAPLVERMADELTRRARKARGVEMPPSIAHFLAHAPRYAATVEPAIRFLQGRDPSLALRIVGRTFLPEGPRFAPLAHGGEEHLAWAFGVLGTTEQARYLASLYVDDLADVVARRDRSALSSSRATPSGSRPARRRSTRCSRRSTPSRRSSTTRWTRSRASSSPRTNPTWSA